MATIQCKLITPTDCILEEEISHAVIPAWDGLFGVLPGRAPIVAKLGLGELRLDFPDQGGDKKTHGGSRSRSSPSHDCVLSSISLGVSRFSLTFGRTMHPWLLPGDVQIRPSQAVSCQGTRTERWRVGRSAIRLHKLLLLAFPACFLT